MILVFQLPNDTLILGCGLKPLEVWGQAARQGQYCLDVVMDFFYTLVMCTPVLWYCHFRQGGQVITAFPDLLLNFSKVQKVSVFPFTLQHSSWAPKHCSTESSADASGCTQALPALPKVGVSAWPLLLAVSEASAH